MVIFCGGLATRLGDHAKDIPKSMIQIEGKPFLEYQIEMLKKQSIKDIVLCAGHLSEKIIEYFGNGEKYGVNIQYSHDGDKPLGPIGALKKAESLLENIFFTMYGDSYVFIDFKRVYSYFSQYDKKALMVVYQNNDRYDISNIVVNNGRVTRYNQEKTPDMKYIDYGVQIFRKKILKNIQKNTFFSTKDFFPKLIKENELLAFEANKRFYHIGNLKALEEFKKYVKTIKD